MHSFINILIRQIETKRRCFILEKKKEILLSQFGIPRKLNIYLISSRVYQAGRQKIQPLL